MTARLTLVFLCASLLLASPAFAANAVALVSDIQGNARIVQGKTTARAALLSDVFADSRLELDIGAKMVLLLVASGEEATLVGPATAQVGASNLSATPPSALTRKKSSVGDTPLRRKDVAQAALVMRTTEQTARPPLLTLSGTRTLEPRPVFRWSPVEGSGPYRFTLFDSRGRVLHEAVTEATELRLPETVALAEGEAYLWEIATRRANGLEHGNFGEFSVADAALRAKAREMRPPEDAPFPARIAYALWLDSHGLADDARVLWTRLARERPDEPMLRKLAES